MSGPNRTLIVIVTVQVAVVLALFVLAVVFGAWL